jgi:predicted nucleic acid-binding protein
MIVLDTNVVSALMRPDLNDVVVAWANRQPELSVWTTSVTVLELRSGILNLPHGRRRAALQTGFDSLLEDLVRGRVLPFDLEAAERAASIFSARRTLGHAVGVLDTQIAGIVMSRNATLATRNVKDFDDLDMPLVNPWED